jgi:hypothetical protein
MKLKALVLSLLFLPLAVRAATGLDAALQLTNAAANQTYTIPFRSTLNDGGGGNFRVITNDGRPTNNVTVFRSVANTNLLFIRQFNEADGVHVTWAGAKRDGSANAVPAIIACRDFILNSYPSGKLVFPPGTYQLASSVDVSGVLVEAYGVTFTGPGQLTHGSTQLRLPIAQSPWQGNLNDTTPAAPGTAINIKWQQDTSNPKNISAYLDYGGGLTVTGGELVRDAITGDVSIPTASATSTIANGAVSNAKLANMATGTVKGRGSAGTGVPEDLPVLSPLTISASGLDLNDAATLDNNARVGVRKNSDGSTFTRRRLNLIEGANVTLTIADDSVNEEVDVTIAASGGGGTGDVVGPASSTDNAVARFDGVTGKLIKNSSVTIDNNGVVTANSYIASGSGGGVLSLMESASDPTTGADEGAVYTKDVAGTTRLFYRPNNNGTPVQLGAGGGGSSSGPSGAIQLSDGAGGFSSAANGIPALSWKESSQQLIATNAVVGTQLLVGKTVDTTGRPIVMNQNNSNNGLRLEYNAAGTTWSELITANDGALVLSTSQGTASELRIGKLTIPAGIELTGTAQTGVQTIQVSRLTADPTAPPNNTALLYAWPNEITPYLFVKHSDDTAVPIGAVIHFPNTVDVVNTTDETTILQWTVPGNLLGADRSIQIDMGGDLLNNSGSNDTITFNVKYGTTTLISRTTGALGTSTPNRSWRLNGFLANKTVSSQVAVIDVRISGTGSGAGFGSFSGITSDGQAGGTSALDSSVARDLVITVQHSVANANTRISRLYAKLRIE